MKLSTVFIGLLALLMPLVGAWSKEDREIFRLRDEIAAAEGSSATFYDLLGVPSTASQEDISKAYRKQSRMLHPDKVKQQLRAKKLAEAKKASAGRKKPGVTVAKSPTAAEIRAAVKLASERQARLSLVANVLRGPGRERYDHFLAHGFPVWKGTEYYYTRYRPGLGTTVTGVLLFGTGAVHYLALYLGWRRQREFVERYVRFARHAAWGESLGVPGLDGLGASGGGGDTLLRHSGPLVVHSDGEAESDDGRDHIPVNRKERRAREREERREAAKKGRKPKPTSAAAAQAQASDGTRTGPQGPKKRVVAENGKVLVVDSLGNVYLEQEDEDGNVEEFLLDPNELPAPTFRDTALYRLPIFLYSVTIGRALRPAKPKTDEAASDAKPEPKPQPRRKPAPRRPAVESSSDEDDDSSDDDSQPTPSSGSSTGDFEVLGRSTTEEAKKATAEGAKASGSQQQSGKARKRGKKR